MDQQSRCGCPVPVIKPPDFGSAVRLPVLPAGMSVDVPYPADPSQPFPRVFTTSADTRQGTSLSTESASGCGCDPRYPRNRRLIPRVSAGYRNPGLNFAAAEVASLVNRILYPVPGIWLSPACVHMPSGNVVVQLATPRGGSFDPVPVFTYNSQAAKSTLGRGYGVSDLFHPVVEQWSDITALISGTGRYLEYTDVAEGSWGTAPASTRNGLKGKTGGGWIEPQPDWVEWHRATNLCSQNLRSGDASGATFVYIQISRVGTIPALSKQSRTQNVLFAVNSFLFYALPELRDVYLDKSRCGEGPKLPEVR